MLQDISYKTASLANLICSIHIKIQEWLHESAVSLRDIERLRQTYKWFLKNLAVLKIKDID